MVTWRKNQKHRSRERTSRRKKLMPKLNKKYQRFKMEVRSNKGLKMKLQQISLNKLKNRLLRRSRKEKNRFLPPKMARQTLKQHHLRNYNLKKMMFKLARTVSLSNSDFKCIFFTLM